MIDIEITSFTHLSPISAFIYFHEKALMLVDISSKGDVYIKLNEESEEEIENGKMFMFEENACFLAEIEPTSNLLIVKSYYNNDINDIREAYEFHCEASPCTLKISDNQATIAELLVKDQKWFLRSRSISAFYKLKLASDRLSEPSIPFILNRSSIFKIADRCYRLGFK